MLLRAGLPLPKKVQPGHPLDLTSMSQDGEEEEEDLNDGDVFGRDESTAESEQIQVIVKLCTQPQRLASALSGSALELCV